MSAVWHLALCTEHLNVMLKCQPLCYCSICVKTGVQGQSARAQIPVLHYYEAGNLNSNFSPVQFLYSRTNNIQHLAPTRSRTKSENIYLFARVTVYLYLQLLFVCRVSLDSIEINHLLWKRNGWKNLQFVHHVTVPKGCQDLDI